MIEIIFGVGLFLIAFEMIGLIKDIKILLRLQASRYDEKGRDRNG